MLTVQLLDKQPRLTVTSLEDKRQALSAGWAWRLCRTRLSKRTLQKGGCASSARNTPAKWILLWRGVAIAWAKPNRGVCVKFPSSLPTTTNKRRPGKRKRHRAELRACLRIRTKAVFARRSALTVENQNHDPADKRDQQQQQPPRRTIGVVERRNSTAHEGSRTNTP